MIVGITRVRCPGCDRELECKLVQSINTATEPSEKARLLAGDINVLTCACGRRTQLAVTVLFHDPAAAYWCQVCPGDDQAMSEGGRLIVSRASGCASTLIRSAASATVRVIGPAQRPA